MTTATEQEQTGKGISMDVRRIMDLLPHRFPFLLVDRVVELIPGKTIQAYKCVSINEGFFQGHFPGLPVMPGVLIVEALAQAGGLLVLSGLDEATRNDNVFLFSGIERVRFRRPVKPGDRLDLHCTLTRHKMRLWKMTGMAYVEGAVAAEAELTAIIAPKEDL